MITSMGAEKAWQIEHPFMTKSDYRMNVSQRNQATYDKPTGNILSGESLSKIKINGATVR